MDSKEKSSEYITFLNDLFRITGVPLCLLQNEDVLLQLPTVAGFPEQARTYLDALKAQPQTLSYIAAPYGAYYGLIRLKGAPLLVFAGPYVTAPLTEASISGIIQAMEAPEPDAAQTRSFLTALPSGSLQSFLSCLSCLHYALNREQVPAEAIIRSPDEDAAAIRTAYTNASYEAREQEQFHNTYLHEMHRLELIAGGNVAEIRKLAANPLPGRHGVIGSDGLRQAKNVFIAACTMYTRAAIAGGLDAEEAYNLSDVYIQTSENYSSVSDVERLLQKMPVDFAERVEREVRFQHVSQPIISAIHYIKEHINQPLQAEDIAAQINLSASYFLKRFKAETGMGLSEFIMRTKVEEARLLLTYTEQSLTDISNYLYFSSQSYFQNVFKKITGMTPGHYRNQQKRSVFLTRS